MATCFRGAVPSASRTLFRLPRLAAVPCRAFQPSPVAILRFFTARASAKAASRAAPNAAKPAAVLPYQPKGPPLPRAIRSMVSEKVLYSAPKQSRFRILCYAAAIACFGAAASSYKFFFTYSKEERDKNNLASWVPLTFGVIAVFWACTGTWLAAAPVGVVKSITAVPNLGSKQGVQMRIEVMRLPGMKNKVMYARPGEVRADSSIAATVAEYAAARQAVINSRRLRPDDPKLLKPFLVLGRWAGRSCFDTMIYTKMSVMREGMVKLRIGGKSVGKVDCAGKLESNGQVLDELISRY